MINHEELEEFKRLYKKHYGENISDQNALEYATQLIGFVTAVCRPTSACVGAEEDLGD